MLNRVAPDGGGWAPARAAEAGPGPQIGRPGDPAGGVQAEDGVELSPSARLALEADALSGPSEPPGEGARGRVRRPGLGEWRQEQIQKRARRRAVDKALESGEPVRFKNSEGAEISLSVSQVTPNEEGNSSYKLAFDGYELEVHLEPGVPPRTALARVADYISQYPPHLRADLKAVELHAGPHPDYPEFAAWVNSVTDSGVIHFQYGTEHLNNEIFDHEMGHIIGDFVEDRQASPEELAQEAAHGGWELDEGKGYVIPDGWAEAIERDGRSVSEYGDTNHAEDFAEFWMVYKQAVEDGPGALERLARIHPHRSWIASHILHERGYAVPLQLPPAGVV